MYPFFVRSATSTCYQMLFVENHLHDGQFLQFLQTDSLGTNFKITFASSLTAVVKRLEQQNFFDIVLLSFTDAQIKTAETLSALVNLSQKVAIVLLIDQTQEEIALNLMRWGIQDFIFKENLNQFLLFKTLICAIQRQKKILEIQKNAAQKITPIKSQPTEYLSSFKNSLAGLAVAIPSDPMFPGQEKWIEVNSALCHSLGYRPEELIFKPCQSVIDQDDFAEELQQLQEIYAGKKDSYIADRRWQCQDGKIIYTRIAVSCIRWPNGIIKHLVTVVLEISDRYEIEQQLKASEEFLTYAINTIPDPIFVKDDQHQFRLVNHALCQLMKQPVEAILGKTDYDFFPQAEADVFREKDQIVFQTGGHHENEEFLTDTKGNQHVLSTKKNVFVKSDGRKILVGTIRDITHYKEQQAKLQENASFLQAILNSSDYGIIATNLEGIICCFNAAAEKILGYSAQEVVGIYTPALIHDPAEVVRRAAELSAELNTPIEPGLEVFLAKARQGEIEEREWTYLGKDGSRIPVMLSVSALRDGCGNITGFVGIAKDITTRKQAERENHLLLQASQIISESDNLSQTLTVILQLFCQTMGWDLAQAWIPTQDGSGLKLSQGWYANDADLESLAQVSQQWILTPGVGLAGRIWETGQPEGIEDISQSDRLIWMRSETIMTSGLNACVGVPVLADTEVLAVLVFFQRTKSSHTQRVIELLNALAAQLASLLQRDRAQAALKLSEKRLQLALEGSALGLWDWNLATGEIYFNPQWKQMLGYDIHEIADHVKSWHNLIHPQDFPQVHHALKAHLAGKTAIYEIEHRMQAKSGEWKWILNVGKVVEYDAEGQPLRITGTHKDISDRKQAEQALQESEARERAKAQELGLVLQNLQKTQTQLVQNEKMAALGQLVGGIAHEINNPISFIYGNVNHATEYAEDLLDLVALYETAYPDPRGEVAEKIEKIDLEFLKQDFKKLLLSMREGASRIKEIVVSLRTFSRLDEADMKEVNIHSGIESTLLILQQRIKAQAGRPKIEVIKEFAELPDVLCYPGQLNQVFMNLLSNAIDALEQKWRIYGNFSPKIWIKTELKSNHSNFSDSQSVVIRITDNGPGILPHLQQRIFDPFFTTKPIGKGTGLGLSISHQIIVDRHQGSLKCHSQVGEGTEFVIELNIK